MALKVSHEAPVITNDDAAAHAPLIHVSPAEAAHYLGISEQTLAVWRCTKRYSLSYLKIGRRVRYKISDLEAFLAQRTVVAQHDDQEVK